MKREQKELVRAALIAAMYAALCYLQNTIFPGSASAMIQFRVAEALMVLAFFSKGAPLGLTVGCLIFNLCMAGTMPLDILVGSFATFCTGWSMYFTRQLRLGGVPWLGLMMPALWNGVLVGWELTFCFGGVFWLNCLYVAIGELLVMFTLGLVIWGVLSRKGVAGRLFG